MVSDILVQSQQIGAAYSDRTTSHADAPALRWPSLVLVLCLSATDVPKTLGWWLVSRVAGHPQNRPGMARTMRVIMVALEFGPRTNDSFLKSACANVVLRCLWILTFASDSRWRRAPLSVRPVRNSE